MSGRQQFVQAGGGLRLYFDALKQAGGIEVILTAVVDDPDHAMRFSGIFDLVEAAKRQWKNPRSLPGRRTR